MNGRVAVTLIRAARRQAAETGEVAKGIYRELKRVQKTKTYPWGKVFKGDPLRKDGGGLANTSSKNSRQRRRDSIIHSTIITQSDLILDLPIFIQGKFNPNCLKVDKRQAFSRTRRAVFMDFEGNQTLIKSIR